ncbi:hypothetical protein GH714_022280 [Hevea brasiliensis]|uniref:Uncharacterized protein n=1 Tax=Hevea brasiliensis TaxID=3981 RepID=A0A6A6LIM6_HEVBR|nr:hypothetical protein GH714_022280 [Hevea brasiliensis]
MLVKSSRHSQFGDGKSVSMGHFVEALTFEATGVDYIDDSELLEFQRSVHRDNGRCSHTLDDETCGTWLGLVTLLRRLGMLGQ